MRKSTKYEAQAYYDSLNTIQVKLKLNERTDKDIIDWVYEKRASPDSSIQGAIKALIREDIDRQRKETRQM